MKHCMDKILCIFYLLVSKCLALVNWSHAVLMTQMMKFAYMIKVRCQRRIKKQSNCPSCIRCIQDSFFIVLFFSWCFFFICFVCGMVELGQIPEIITGCIISKLLKKCCNTKGWSLELKRQNVLDVGNVHVGMGLGSLCIHTKGFTCNCTDYKSDSVFACAPMMMDSYYRSE